MRPPAVGVLVVPMGNESFYEEVNTPAQKYRIVIELEHNLECPRIIWYI